MAGFDDGKDDGALRTIGEVSEALGIKPHVLRYWEAQFPQLRPLKRSGGRRYYRASDVTLVETIDRLVNREGYTLKGAQAVLRGAARSDLGRGDHERGAGGGGRAAIDPGAAPGVRLMVTEGPDIADTLASLKAIRGRLAAALEA
jgi:DNA-binding transcriptional MerR regulator